MSIKPQLCTLAKEETLCHAAIEVEWRSVQLESLCVVIESFPEVNNCWENSHNGRHVIELSFKEELLVELRDLASRELLAARTLAIMHEAIRYRRKRLQPWNIFN